MKAIQFNDTSRFHLGCAAVNRVLHGEIQRAGFEVIESVYGNTWRFSKSMPVFSLEKLSNADLVVINGEGTMHDNSRMAKFLLEEIVAKNGDKKIAFVNSLWQRMSPKYSKIIEACDLIVFREPLSHECAGIADAHIMPDLSFYEVPSYSELEHVTYIKGTFYKRLFQDLELDENINVKRDDWSVLVNKLRHADACFTGKHHEVIACCVARCPFVVPELSTHKVSALAAFVDGRVPTVPDDASEHTILKALEAAANDNENFFMDLFDAMESLRARIRLRTLLGDITG